jgi:hypothetical protein
MMQSAGFKEHFLPLPDRLVLVLGLALAFLRVSPVGAHPAGGPEGIIAGVRVPPALWDVIDPGGHNLDPAGIRCSECLSAFVNDGYCPRSHIGYVDGRAYVSRLSYLLAKDGQHVEVLPSCATCRAHISEPGWCDHCGRGIVGTLAIRNHADFNEILMERERLIAAVRLASRCDLCAVAFFTHGRCPRCRIDYKDGPHSVHSAREGGNHAT